MSDRIRNHVVLSETPPDRIPTPDAESADRAPVDGDLWVDSNLFVIYAYDSNEVTVPVTNSDGTVISGTTGWVGVTDKSNTGSIVYFRDTAPGLLEIYPALNNLPDDAISPGPLDVSPLPGTMWYDTKNLLLKIYLVSEANSDGSWVSVTSAHYMTQAVQKGLEEMDTKVTALEAQLAAIGGS